ncbi:uncharacterized protein LOC134906486 [Pseudophryne corroboree]|uniref:uncharacterized protein LOC134906486 n=1 Tax=Pseudophryne corroboree TaxID=495146 RepID=UPI003081C4A0
MGSEKMMSSFRALGSVLDACEEGSMATWTDQEVRELLSIRGEEEIMRQITGTVKDAVIYKNISKMLEAMGIIRTQQQVLNKMKTLKKQFLKVHDNNRKKSGVGRIDWQYYDICANIFGNTAICSPVSLSSSSQYTATEGTPEETQTSSDVCPSSPLLIDDTPEDSDTSSQPSINTSRNDDSITATIEDVVEAQTSDSGTVQSTVTPTLQKNIYTVPPRRKKLNRAEQVAKAMSNVLVDQLREMDATMSAQEDARLDRFLEAERQMHDAFLSQVMTMQERMSREQYDRHRELHQMNMAFYERMTNTSRAPIQHHNSQYPPEQGFSSFTPGPYYAPNTAPSSAQSPEFTVLRNLP